MAEEKNTVEVAANVKADKPARKFGKQLTKTIQGVKYTFVFPGVKAAIEILDRSKNAYGVRLDSAFYQEIMDNVIGAPHVDYEFFETHDGFLEVMNEADRFLGSLL